MMLNVRTSLYDRDYYLWLETTANHLKRGELGSLDIANLIEELESLGRKEKAELRNRLMVLFEHLLKLKYWKSELEWNKRGWQNTITEQTVQIELLIQDSPSLKYSLNEINAVAYKNALRITKNKTQLKDLPEKNPFDLEQILFQENP